MACAVSHDYMIQQFCIKQLLQFSWPCRCSDCFIGILFCLSKTWV